MEYTEEQKLVLEILKPFEEIIDSVLGNKIYKQTLYDTIKEIKNKYSIQVNYPTLREYINKNSYGAYHVFKFIIFDNVECSCIDTEDFERIYNPNILDMYLVISDNKKDNAGNCENYECEHHLVLKNNPEYNI